MVARAPSAAHTTVEGIILRRRQIERLRAGRALAAQRPETRPTNGTDLALIALTCIATLMSRPPAAARALIRWLARARARHAMQSLTSGDLILLGGSHKVCGALGDHKLKTARRVGQATPRRLAVGGRLALADRTTKRPIKMRSSRAQPTECLFSRARARASALSHTKGVCLRSGARVSQAAGGVRARAPRRVGAPAAANGRVRVCARTRTTRADVRCALAFRLRRLRAPARALVRVQCAASNAAQRAVSSRPRARASERRPRDRYGGVIGGPVSGLDVRARTLYDWLARAV